MITSHILLGLGECALLRQNPGSSQKPKSPISSSRFQNLIMRLDRESSFSRICFGSQPFARGMLGEHRHEVVHAAAVEAVLLFAHDLCDVVAGQGRESRRESGDDPLDRAALVGFAHRASPFDPWLWGCAQLVSSTIAGCSSTGSASPFSAR